MICFIENLKIPLETKIWRYMNFSKFMSLITSRSLFFTRMNKFDDEYEGVPYNLFERINMLNEWYENYKISDYAKKCLKEIKEKYGDKSATNVLLIFDKFVHDNQNELISMGIGLKDMALASCWHINSDYSEAMWKVYANPVEGVAIETTVNNLRKSLENLDENIIVGKVLYSNKKPKDNGLRFFYKRPCFSYENEYRLIVNDFDFKKNISGKLVGRINLDTLIGTIHISPKAPDWFKLLVEDILHKYKVNKVVKHNDFYKLNL